METKLPNFYRQSVKLHLTQTVTMHNIVVSLYNAIGIH